ncbi:MAG: Insertion element protein [Nitrospirae bacterium]|nr:Insertion element protein [Nitrospirota bacterium]
MTAHAASEGFIIKCPRCNLDAVYKYGKTWQGKQRFLCLICGRQFSAGIVRSAVKDRPVCPVCGRVMHLYKREEKVWRFRCSGYPGCKTFTKTDVREGEHELLHS